ncbi:MAG: helix-turn-helix transcriptional regulator [Lentisphaeria bacterium]|nr:helix-turn-helix transcriptional regulator [Lentisphaeria bacterium]
MKSRPKNLLITEEVSFRKIETSALPLWLQVRSAGYYHVLASWSGVPEKKKFAEFFWCARGTLRFSGEPEKLVLHQGDFCVLFPGDFHCISATEESELYWFTFDGPHVHEVIRAFDLTRVPRAAGFFLKEIFQQLILETAHFAPASCFAASAAAYRLITAAVSVGIEPEEQPLLFKKFRELVDWHLGNCAIGITEYASMLQCHRSTLTRVVRECTGNSPGLFLQNARMARARHLLSTTLMSVKEIGSRCGFNNSNYFVKVFRRHFGKTPSDFKRTT